MDLFLEDDYKNAIRARLKDRATTRKPLTLKKVSEKIAIQYTYLSKALNDEKTHLSEDHLFAITRVLDLLPEEADYLMLLRSHAVASNLERKADLKLKLERIRKARKLRASMQEFNAMQVQLEMAYLLDPLCLLTNIALHLDEYFHHPKKLCVALGVSPGKLRAVLRNLEQLGFVELGAGEFEVRKMLKSRFHYNTDHPLMRVHQSLLKQYASSQLLKTAETDKHAFMATFTADEATFEKIKQEFQGFLGKVEKLAGQSKAKGMYQLSFDLFRWL
ncbi:MAG: DUF4423 domain-containing protein [Deltaproteobacteria bacterium]|nr:DUF4423 domain-containing protein [Deltaproteobacteria bacterium]